ncbi:hypothetical protein D3C85_1338170 [compost metagenome]
MTADPVGDQRTQLDCPVWGFQTDKRSVLDTAFLCKFRRDFHEHIRELAVDTLRLVRHVPLMEMLQEPSVVQHQIKFSRVFHRRDIFHQREAGFLIREVEAIRVEQRRALTCRRPPVEAAPSFKGFVRAA